MSSQFCGSCERTRWIGTGHAVSFSLQVCFIITSCSITPDRDCRFAIAVKHVIMELGTGNWKAFFMPPVTPCNCCGCTSCCIWHLLQFEFLYYRIYLGDCIYRWTARDNCVLSGCGFAFFIICSFFLLLNIFRIIIDLINTFGISLKRTDEFLCCIVQ